MNSSTFLNATNTSAFSNQTNRIHYPTATIINSAWLQVEIPDRGYGRAKPYYVALFHDVTSTTVEERVGWTVANTVATVLMVAASIFNVVVYMRRGVKRDFLILTCCSYGRNGVFSICYCYGLLVVLPTGRWEESALSCTIPFWIIYASGGFGLLIEPMISYERRLCITSNSISYKSNTLKIVSITIALLGMCLVLSAGFALWPSRSFTTQWVIIPGVNGDKPIQFCGDWDFNIADDFDTSFFVFMYYAILFAGSAVVLGINYWKIFKFIDNLKKSRSISGISGTQPSTAGTTDSKMSKGFQFADWQRREIYLVKISVVLYLVFVISYIPGFMSNFDVAIWNIGSWTVEQAWFRKFCVFCIILGMILTAVLQCITPSRMELIFDKFEELKLKGKLRRRTVSSNDQSTSIIGVRVDITS